MSPIATDFDLFRQLVRGGSRFLRKRRVAETASRARVAEPPGNRAVPLTSVPGRDDRHDV